MDDDDEQEFMVGLSKILGEVISRAREERRPRLEDVIRVVNDAFQKLRDSGELDVEPLMEGPVTWTWGDRSMMESGFERVYSLTTSVMEGAEGYPLMTIRQTVAPHFDAQLSFSSLIFGPTDDDIGRSVGMLITNHSAAFQGVRDAVSTMAHSGPMAALERVKAKKAETDAVGTSAVIPKKGELN